MQEQIIHPKLSRELYPCSISSDEIRTKLTESMFTSHSARNIDSPNTIESNVQPLLEVAGGAYLSRPKWLPNQRQTIVSQTFYPITQMGWFQIVNQTSTPGDIWSLSETEFYWSQTFAQ